MWPNPQETADLVTFTEEILNGKLHFSCSVLEISAFLKIAAQAFRAGDFLNIFFRFSGFQSHFLVNIFLSKKYVYTDLQQSFHRETMPLDNFYFEKVSIQNYKESDEISNYLKPVTAPVNKPLVLYVKRANLKWKICMVEKKGI